MNQERIIYFKGYKNLNMLKKEKEYKEINKEINNSTKIRKEDQLLILKILKPITEIEEKTLGDFLKYPVKNKKVLIKYFNFYSFYYKEIPSSKILDKIIDIYKKYNQDLSNQIEK